MQLATTKSGRPALWENGGGSTSTGHAVLVCDTDGGPAPAQYIPRGGPLAGGEHALCPVSPGMIVVSARHWRDVSIHVQQIETIVPGAQAGTFEATTRELGRFEEGAWTLPLPADVPLLALAAARAKTKSYDYHCRSVYWAFGPGGVREDVIAAARADNERRVAERAARAAASAEADRADREADRLRAQKELAAQEARNALIRPFLAYGGGWAAAEVLWNSATEVERETLTRHASDPRAEAWGLAVATALGDCTARAPWGRAPGDAAMTLARHVAKMGTP